MSKARNWVFTLNNPDGLLDPSLWPGAKYCVYQHEIGESGTEHFQGYVEFAQPKTLKALKQLLPTAHLEIRQGTSEQAIAYSTKEDTRIDGPYHWGVPAEQGKRTDLQAIYDLIKNGATEQDILEAYPAQYMRYFRGIQQALTLLSDNVQRSSYLLGDFTWPRQPLENALLLHGPPGTGKTSFALAHFKAPLLCSHVEDLRKLNYPQLHDGIVFDDLSFRHWPAESIIQLLDVAFKRSIHMRYANVAIPKGVPRIFTHNEADIFRCTGITPFQLAAIQRRLTSVEVLVKLFK